jgi:ribosomal protein S18 acetylase RimI-like enzyme
MDGPVRIRPAVKADAGNLAVLVDIAGEGLPSLMWNDLKAPRQSTLEFGRSRAARETGGFSYRNATMAECEGEPAGALIGYPLDEPYDLGNLDELSQFVRPLVLLESRAPGSWYVNVLACFPEFRGRGIGLRLLAEAEVKARETGARELSIIVASENEGAARLYARAGYRERARERLAAYPGAPHGGDWVLMIKTAQLAGTG